MCIPCLFTISTAEVGVIERWGKYSRLVQPGLNVIMCPMEQMVGRLSFRVQQLDVRVETKTLDNVFLTAVVSVQYQILKEKVYDGKFCCILPVPCGELLGRRTVKAETWFHHPSIISLKIMKTSGELLLTPCLSL